MIHFVPLADGWKKLLLTKKFYFLGEEPELWTLFYPAWPSWKLGHSVMLLVWAADSRDAPSWALTPLPFRSFWSVAPAEKPCRSPAALLSLSMKHSEAPQARSQVRNSFQNHGINYISVVSSLMSPMSVVLLFCLGSAWGKRPVITQSFLFAFFFPPF